MNLPALSIKRPVLAFMVNAVIVLFGLISFQRMGVDRFPYVEFPMVSVTTVMRGANPEIMDTSVTSVIESQVNSIPGIEHITSSSSPGASVVGITFDLSKNIDTAFNEVQAKINQIRSRLPEDAEAPIVSKVETNAQPIMWLALQGDRTTQQLNRYALTVVKKKLETIDGVGEVRLGGQRDRTIRVELDPRRMAALGVTTQDLLRAFDTEHFQMPAGFLASSQTEMMLKMDLEYHRPQELEQLVVAYRNGAPVRVRDVATIEDGLEDMRRVARFKGEPTVGLGIVKIANTNTVAIIQEVKKRLEEEIIPELPPGMKITISSDTSTFIVEMVRALEEHLWLGMLFASLVVLAFLKSLRSTLIIALALPVSLLGAAGAMYFAGFTINTVTLLALLLLIGVVVDDAIVVLENIYRHRETLNSDPLSAAVDGTREVVFAVLATTLALVSIFAPVIFLGGIVGRFLQSFAVVVTFGVLASWLVSMTLTPMLCSRYLQVRPTHGRLYHMLDRPFQAMDRGYRALLALALNHRWKALGLTLLIVASTGFFFSKVGKGFVPDEDEGQFMVFAKAPLGVSIEYMDGRVREIEQALARHPEIRNYFTAIGLGQAGQVNSAIAFVRMVPREQRSVRQQDLIRKLQGELAQIPGVRAFATKVSIVSGMRSEPLQFVLSGAELEQVAQYSQQMMGRLSGDPRIGRLDLDLQLDLPQLNLEVDRTRAASLGLNARDIASAASILAGGLDVAKFNDIPGDGQRYDIRLKAREGNFRTPDDLRHVYLRGNSGNLVRLDTVAQFNTGVGPAVIGRYDLRYSAMFFGSPSVPLADAIDIVKTAGAEILPLGYNISLIGEAEEFAKTSRYIIFTFALALLLVYMVLASQFNSFVQPFIIMVAQPLAMIGGVAALWLSGYTLNIYSMIGMVLLVGLVAKNAILLVDLTNTCRARGQAIDAALLEACPIRMRPVLMTSLTLILALLPAALGAGAGADTNGPLSVAVIGGMVTSTALTLVVIPVVYSLVENGLQRLAQRRTAIQEI